MPELTAEDQMRAAGLEPDRAGEVDTRMTRLPAAVLTCYRGLHELRYTLALRKTARLTDCLANDCYRTPGYPQGFEPTTSWRKPRLVCVNVARP